MGWSVFWIVLSNQDLVYYFETDEQEVLQYPLQLLTHSLLQYVAHPFWHALVHPPEHEEHSYLQPVLQPPSQLPEHDVPVHPIGLFSIALAITGLLINATAPIMGKAFFAASLKNSLLPWRFLFSPFSILVWFCLLSLAQRQRYSSAIRAEPPKLILISGCWVWTPI